MVFSNSVVDDNLLKTKELVHFPYLRKMESKPLLGFQSRSRVERGILEKLNPLGAIGLIKVLRELEACMGSSYGLGFLQQQFITLRFI